MRHRKSRHKLNRFTSWRKATLKSMSRNMLIQQRMRTSVTRAKAARPMIEALITLAKRNTLSAKRKAASILDNDHGLVNRLFNDIGPKFKDRIGGYTRIIKLGRRRGDDSELAIFELTEINQELIKKPKKKKIAKSETPAEETKVKGSAEEKKAGKPETKKPEEKKSEEIKPKAKVAVKEKLRAEKTKKPTKRFLGRLKNIFQKERDSL
ncbi:MAG: 50S ribosomal protein L17 [Candidatus Omnitrophica bacterium]|nr:50S ribosomal protein L17 [Candidatus Omnitrophota bacterium]